MDPMPNESSTGTAAGFRRKVDPDAGELAEEVDEEDRFETPFFWHEPAAKSQVSAHATRGKQSKAASAAKGAMSEVRIG